MAVLVRAPGLTGAGRVARHLAPGGGVLGVELGGGPVEWRLPGGTLAASYRSMSRSVPFAIALEEFELIP